MKAAEKTPVTVLTGYLGAGKTTLLNRILSEDHGKKYAVIVNEFGEAGIDGGLVVGADEEIFEMNNGCICCTVRGDLIRIMAGLFKRGRAFDGIIIETTGLADPTPVIQTFFVDEDIKARTRLDGIITVADAHHLPQRLIDTHEAAEQIACADVVLLNKTDLVEEGALQDVSRQIRALNPSARIIPCERGQVPLADILDLGAFDLNRILARFPDFLESEHDHEHDSGIASVSLTLAAPLDAGKFDVWLQDVLEKQGPDILRFKGILRLAGSSRPLVVQGVHMMMDGMNLPETDKPQDSRLVFIGRKLNRAALMAGFAACAA